MSGRNATRKRQSRIAFTPLPSSSPALKGYPKQIQDRAAAVTLDVSPSPAKRRKLKHDSIPQLDGVNDSMPTPAATMERGTRRDAENDSQSDSEPVRGTQRNPSSQAQSKITSRRQSRQQHLDFSSARDSDTFSPPVKLASQKPQSSARSGIFGSTQRQRLVVDISSDESEELPSPSAIIAKPKKKLTKSPDKTQIASSSARRTRSAQQALTVDSDASEENIVVGNRHLSPIEIASADDDEEDMPTTLGTQRRKRAARRSSFISSSPPQVESSEDELQIIEKPKPRRRPEESDEDNDVLVTPSSCKLKRSRTSQREKDDLEEDLEYLGPSSDVETSARKPRNTQTAEKSKRQSALDQLRRRRSGQPVEPDDSGDEEDGEAGSGEGQDDPGESEEDGDGGPPQPISSAQMFKEDEYDDDFVDEDDEEETLGVPTDIPIEFTRYASLKPKELFRWAVEWMVQKKINPAFGMNDPIYELTFRKLNDEVKGLSSSKFESSVWRPEFSMALRSRPDIAYEPIDRQSPEHFMLDHCQACNRTGHPATFQIQFQGKPYHQETLEEVAGNDYYEGENDSSSEEDDHANDDDQPAYTADGREIAPASTIYYVGKFCMGNAQTAHALVHWRYHLNEWVVSWLTKEGYNTPAMIVEREKLNTTKRRKQANKIVDRMDNEGVVKELWSDFRNNLEEARNSKQGRFR